MRVVKRYMTFDEGLFDRHPDLKNVLKPKDHYPELENVLKNRSPRLPIGSINTKVIMNDGEIVERIYKTPKGQVISLFSNYSNICSDQTA